MGQSNEDQSANVQILVVVPAYNAARFLKHTLESVKAQTHQDWICLVSDDGSTDNTADLVREMAQEDARIRLVCHANGRVSRARNRGAAQFPAIPYLLFLDADDVLEPDALQLLSEALDTHPACVAAHGYPHAIDAGGHQTSSGGFENAFRHRQTLVDGKVVRSATTDMTSFRMCCVNCPIISPGATMIRRQAFDAVGGFTPALNGTEDWDLWTRLCRLSDLFYVDRPVLGYRLLNQGLSSNHGRMVREGQKARKRVLDDPANTAQQRRLIRAAYRAFYRELAEVRLKEFFSLPTSTSPKARIRVLGLGLANLFLSLYGRPPWFLVD